MNEWYRERCAKEWALGCVNLSPADREPGGRRDSRNLRYSIAHPCSESLSVALMQFLNYFKVVHHQRWQDCDERGRGPNEISRQ